MASTHTNSRRLIEDWFPVNEISIEAIRERAGAVPNPAPHQLHVWWARRPLAPSRAAAAASLLSGPPAPSEFYGLLGTHPGIVDEQKDIDVAKIQGLRLKQGFSKFRGLHAQFVRDRAGVVTPELGHRQPSGVGHHRWRRIHTLRGIPARVQNHCQRAESGGRPILRATCEWPQKYGWELLENFQDVKRRFLERVEELIQGLYPALHNKP